MLYLLITATVAGGAIGLLYDTLVDPWELHSATVERIVSHALCGLTIAVVTASLLGEKVL